MLELFILGLWLGISSMISLELICIDMFRLSFWGLGILSLRYMSNCLFLGMLLWLEWGLEDDNSFLVYLYSMFFGWFYLLFVWAIIDKIFFFEGFAIIMRSAIDDLSFNWADCLELILTLGSGFCLLLLLWCVYAILFGLSKYEHFIG